jgi:2-alkyl-3-oxoalkanoate reductase
MNTLVTGATGFLGARVVDALLKDFNQRVYFVGRSLPKDKGLVERGARFIQGDLLDSDYCYRCVKNIDTIIHCAGLAGTWGDYQNYYRANVVATKNLLESARVSGVGRFINISSPSIYFEFKDQFNLSESYRPNKFSNAYAETKWEAEQLVTQAHGPNFLTVSLRPRSVIGAGDQNVLPRLIRLKETGGLVQIGGGKNIVDITTIGNLVDAICLCMNAEEQSMGDIYNITNGAPINFWEFVELVLRKAGLSTTRKKLPYWPVMAAATLNEFICRLAKKKKEPTLLPISVGVISFSMTLNIEKARTKLGYKPRFSTEDGINEFIEGF